MGANLSLKRIMLVALVSSLPILRSVASPGSGGPSSGGSGAASSGGSGGYSSSSSSGGHSGSNSTSGHSSNSSNSSNSGNGSSHSNNGHSSTGLSNGHFASGSNNTHSSSAPKGNHPGDPPSPTVITGRPITGTDRSKLLPPKPVQVDNRQHFGSGYAHNDLAGNGDTSTEQPRHLRHLFGFIPYWSTH
jgi:hypothetical protein